MKRLITYLLYGTGLIILIYLGVQHYEALKLTSSRTFELMPPIRFTALYATVFGAYLAVPGFVIMLRRPGKVQFDWLRFLVIGVPTFLICFSGTLGFYVKAADLGQLIFRFYSMFNSLGALLAGVACGYTLLSSVNKVEIRDSVPTRSYPLAKILTLCIMVALILYISLNGIIHPLELVSVHADVSDADNYTIAVGEVSPKQINYVFTFENWPKNWAFSELFANDKIRIEPKERLQQLVEDRISIERAGIGTGSEGNLLALTISYRIGPFQGADNPANTDRLSPEVLKDIEEALFDADLVMEVGKKTKRYHLSNYQGGS